MSFPPVSADLRNFLLEVARGNVADFEHRNINSANDDTPVGVYEDITDIGDLTLPTSAESLEIVSDSVNDASAGTGAQTVRIEGLDGNYIEQSEIVTLNGITAVALANTYLRTFKVIVLTAGSTGSNEGLLTLRIASGGASRMQVRVNRSVSASSFYTIPVGKTGFILSLKSGMGYGSAASVLECSLYLKETSAWVQVYQGIRNLELIGTSFEEFSPPIKVIEKTDIKLRGISTAASRITASYNLILVNNTAPVPETEIVTLVNESFSQGEVILVPGDTDKRPFILFAELDKDGLATSIELNIGDNLILKDTSVAGTKEVLNSPVLGLSGEDIRVKAVGAGSGKYKLTCGLVDKIVKGEDLA